jgi:hypothetical protein
MAQATEAIQLQVKWGRCADGSWANLNTVDLKHSAFSHAGNYIIWHKEKDKQPARVVYVGQGEFRDRLGAHRDDERIQAYATFGLLITWAVVEKAKRDGVELHLATKWKPLVGERHPVATPISVNSPWV